MKPVLLGTLVCMLTVVGACLSTQYPTAAQSTEPRGAYVALGDSIAFGVGSSLPERRGYPALVRAYLEIHGDAAVPSANHAMPGETAASFLSNGQLDAFARELAMFADAGISVNIVTISLGGNEMLAQRYGSTAERQTALDEFRISLDRAISRIREETGPETTMILTTYYDLSEGDPSIPTTDAWWIEQFNNVIRETAGRADARVAELAGAFRGQIEDYTYHPYDVHPDNQGYRAIATQVWRALGLDAEPPAIEVVSAPEATRRTPTLQLEVADNIAVEHVRVLLNDGTTLMPVDLGDGRYVLLLDLRNDDAGEYSLVIEAEDGAGNVRQVEHRIVVQAD